MVNGRFLIDCVLGKGFCLILRLLVVWIGDALTSCHGGQDLRSGVVFFRGLLRQQNFQGEKRVDAIYTTLRNYHRTLFPSLGKPVWMIQSSVVGVRINDRVLDVLFLDPFVVVDTETFRPRQTFVHSELADDRLAVPFVAVASDDAVLAVLGRNVNVLVVAETAQTHSCHKS